MAYENSYRELKGRDIEMTGSIGKVEPRVVVTEEQQPLHLRSSSLAGIDTDQDSWKTGFLERCECLLTLLDSNTFSLSVLTC